MKTLTGLAVALASATAALPAVAQTPPPPPPAEAKLQAMPYVMASGMSDLFEINSSQIALQKSQNPAIKRFATMMIRDHQKTTATTMAAAKKAGLTPTPPMLDAGATASITELQQAAPGDFDRIYLAQQLPAHKAALDLQQSYAAGGDQAALRANAKAAAPIVKRHVDMVTKMQAGEMGAGHKM
ncbi:DUF4142 domain-containing protein [uncultured Sphingomonas sp.]|uniref:DUF4142 domain-containing protein n=1 Tax=uncultured Sphingomonas sp. TaxID=158754 RepID=UPI0025EF9E2F|nr:DUF4142 domain-containing protein [uncultured Sphingomonas sp.]